MWGVNYVANEESGFAALPEPNHFMLKDITEWEKVIRNPQMPDVDWEQMAKKDLETAMIDRSKTAVDAALRAQSVSAINGFYGI